MRCGRIQHTYKEKNHFLFSNNCILAFSTGRRFPASVYEDPTAYFAFLTTEYPSATLSGIRPDTGYKKGPIIRPVT